MRCPCELVSHREEGLDMNFCVWEEELGFLQQLSERDIQIRDSICLFPYVVRSNGEDYMANVQVGVHR